MTKSKTSTHSEWGAWSNKHLQTTLSSIICNMMLFPRFLRILTLLSSALTWDEVLWQKWLWKTNPKKDQNPTDNKETRNSTRSWNQLNMKFNNAWSNWIKASAHPTCRMRRTRGANPEGHMLDQKNIILSNLRKINTRKREKEKSMMAWHKVEPRYLKAMMPRIHQPMATKLSFRSEIASTRTMLEKDQDPRNPWTWDSCWSMTRVCLLITVSFKTLTAHNLCRPCSPTTHCLTEAARKSSTRQRTPKRARRRRRKLWNRRTSRSWWLCKSNRLKCWWICFNKRVCLNQTNQLRAVRLRTHNSQLTSINLSEVSSRLTNR